MNWKIVTVIVCSFGFFKELRPSEAYLVAYLRSDWKNLTETQINNQIFPWWTYAYLIWLVPVFLLTDFLRYKPMLVSSGAAYIATWALLLWAQGVAAMRAVEVLYGLCTACEVGYYSYLYAVVEEGHFKKVASFTRAAILIGKFAAYLLSQLFVSFDVMNYFQLHIFSFVSLCIAFLIAIVLPRPASSELFHKGDSNTKHEDLDEKVHDEIEPENPTPPAVHECDEQVSKSTSMTGVRSVITFLLGEVKSVYTSKTVLIWSVWWAFASCGNLQVENYIQNLWNAIAPDADSKSKYNGAVEAAETLLGALTVLAVGFLPVDWTKRGRAEVLIAVVCGTNAAFLIVMGRTGKIWVAYVLYIVFRVTYQVVITIANVQIARSLTRQRYGLVFGCNTFMALVIETILTVIVVDETGFGVDIRTQFFVYGCYFIGMAAMFIIVVVLRLCDHSMLPTTCYPRDIAKADTHDVAN